MSIDDGKELAPTARPTGAAEAASGRTVAEFFAGIGLVGLALERQGWAVAFANDIDPKKFEMFADNFPNHAARYKLADIHALSAADAPTVTLATACFPCTDLSLAGRRNGLEGRQSGALLGFLRVLREMGGRRPPLAMLENVAGFLTCRGGKDFRTALGALNELGYAVDAFLLDAVRFVPQSRPRLFVVGASSGAPRDDSLIEPRRCPESSLRPAALARFIRREASVEWRIMDLPEPPAHGGALSEILEDLPDDSNEWWSRERVDYLLSQMSPRHAHLVRERIGQASYSYGTAFRRMRHGRSMAELRIDGVAGCLRTPRGGSSRQILARMGKGTVAARHLTARECARLQGVPDSYKINVPKNQALFGFGDAVCVPVIEWIAQHCLNAVAEQIAAAPALAAGSSSR